MHYLYHIIELRFITNRNSSAPLLAADVDGDQEEEEGESYEVALGVITNRPVESSMNWQGELDDSDEVKQYCNNPTYI